MRFQGAVAISLCALLTWDDPVRAETTQASESEAGVGRGGSYSVETTASYHTVDRAYFGTGERRNTWGEGFSRLRLSYGLPAGLWFGAGGVLMGTAGTDYFGTSDVGDGRLDQLVVGVSRIGGAGLSAAVGRQELIVGDGFVIGDGYYDRRAALWNIPLSFYDGVRVDYRQGALHALAFGADLSCSFGSDGVCPNGTLSGAEAGWAPAEGSDVALACFRREDTGATDVDATAVSLRASFGRGPLSFAGEAVMQGGSAMDVTLAGRGGHAGVTFAPEGMWKPVLRVECFYFSGDDPATAEDESYLPWQFRWSDWSRYYVGDLLASTMGTSTDMRIAYADVGVTPREGTGLRVLAHRMDLDTGASRGLDAGAAKAYAYEYDLVIDQAFNEAVSAYVMAALAAPLDAARATSGTAHSGQIFAAVTFKFAGTLGR